ncbi:uncharacterized protein LOC103375174 [Stegastes partitus]|uniref:Uncharacterized protein LOC103375174 n=1 Tax=Stegastes partitus TaxID=144197 RepID=A0A9Y4NUR1_9TELE|nr:PREDICTED: uncharacterized protein LOC103375174 [Stegastes partitus]
MGGRNCCVKYCRCRSHDHHGRKIPNGLTFHCFPAWRTNEGGHISELTKRRRAAWVAAVGRSSITFDSIPSSMRVCSRHFHSGRPAYEMLESDPDWVPSLNLGHHDRHLRRAECLPQTQKQKQTSEKRPAETSEAPQTRSEAAGDLFPSLHPDHDEGDSRWAERLSISKKKQMKRKRIEMEPTETFTSPQIQSEAAEGFRKPSVPPWREVKSVLQSLLQTNTTVSKKPEDETQDRPAADEELSFRDFFRDTLEASLEASIRSRAQAKTFHV